MTSFMPKEISNFVKAKRLLDNTEDELNNVLDNKNIDHINMLREKLTSCYTLITDSAIVAINYFKAHNVSFKGAEDILDDAKFQVSIYATMDQRLLMNSIWGPDKELNANTASKHKDKPVNNSLDNRYKDHYNPHNDPKHNMIIYANSKPIAV